MAGDSHRRHAGKGGTRKLSVRGQRDVRANGVLVTILQNGQPMSHRRNVAAMAVQNENPPKTAADERLGQIDDNAAIGFMKAVEIKSGIKSEIKCLK